MPNRKKAITIILLGVILMMAAGHLSNRIFSIPYINDGAVEWENIEYVEVYFDGCAVPPTSIIDDSRIVNELVSYIRNTRKYNSVPKESYIEGLCDIWVRFSNGVCVGTYQDVNQGYIDLELRATGGPFYRLPNKFRKTVLGLLEEYKDVLPYREALKEKIMDFGGYSDEEKRVICVAIDHVNSIEILRDYPTVAIERLERVPVQYGLDKETRIDEMDWLVTIGDPGSHNANFKIIDSETYEYLAYIPGA